MWVRDCARSLLPPAPGGTSAGLKLSYVGQTAPLVSKLIILRGGISCPQGRAHEHGPRRPGGHQRRVDSLPDGCAHPIACPASLFQSVEKNNILCALQASGSATSWAKGKRLHSSRRTLRAMCAARFVLIWAPSGRHAARLSAKHLRPSPNVIAPPPGARNGWVRGNRH